MAINEYEIDELLRSMAVEEKIHFAPHYICQRIGLDDIKEVTNYLLLKVPKTLLVTWEVECPQGHSHYKVSHPTEIDSMELQECSYCGIPYYPDKSRVWLIFNFNPDYSKSVKKNRIYNTDANNRHPNFFAEPITIK